MSYYNSPVPGRLAIPVDELSPRSRRFLGFQDLMQQRVQDVLLVATFYDYYTLSQDGRLNEQFLSEFLELNLRHTPNITRVFTGKEAVALARQSYRYNLIITSIELADMNVLQLVAALRREGIQTPVILLAYDRRGLQEFVARNDMSSVERTFLWQGDVRILLAIVKYMEDRMNVEHDVGVVGVPAIILVEDNIRYYSSFLPVIYTELVKHSQSLMPEGLNLSDKLMRIRARPKILLCTDYEEAIGYFERYSDEILGIISDVQFPRGGKPSRDAGAQLAQAVRQARPDLPIMLQSSHPENEALAQSVGASFLLKGSPRLLNQVRRFMVESLRIGDFVFRLPDGMEVGRASDLKTLEHLLETVPAESIAYHGKRNDFSNWLKARTEFALADKLRPRKVSEFASLEDLREMVVEAIAEYRMERNRGEVVDFDRASFDATASFYRIGGGSLGGKARGLAFIAKLLNQYDIDRFFPGVNISVPTSVVLGTEVFDRFIEDNGLADFALQCDSDEDLLRRFRRTWFHRELKKDLKAFLTRHQYPLAVRSSSLLEDSQFQPFAGVYETYMLPNDHPRIDVRLEQLLYAVKRVYASTFSARAKAFFDATQYRLEEEKMAVIVQKVVGSPHGPRFYPDFSGVARSCDFYARPPAKSQDGIAAVALGLGKTVMEGGACVRFSPKYPRHLLEASSVRSLLENSQRQFYAVDIGPRPRADSAGVHPWDLSAAAEDGTLSLLASTYSPENDAVYDGVSRTGIRIVTLASILKHDAFPLAEILEILLEISKRGTSSDVELEFAVDLTSTPTGKREFGFLQLRPLALTGELDDVVIGELDPDTVLCRSQSVLGHGLLRNLYDAVVVDYHRFERSESRKTAEVVSRLNAGLRSEGRPYVLIGVGRWGSNEPTLGIPVTWPQIAGARVIVEAGFRDHHVSPSQGTHFFQNLSSNNVGYFTVNPEAGEGYLDWTWLAAQPARFEDGAVRHVRLDAPLFVKMDGKKREGVILKPGLGEAHR
ncbi:MAG TPA: PEP/pyruvate-binding domain-containing protein [Vicinamibacteria bacterium]|nr:PEP/pyruvate-binding domain-containing protein [Vicinamibacteria bacterium]